MISSAAFSFDRSRQHTTQCMFLFLSSCMTQGDSSFHEGMNILFPFFPHHFLLQRPLSFSRNPDSWIKLEHRTNGCVEGSQVQWAGWGQQKLTPVCLFFVGVLGLTQSRWWDPKFTFTIWLSAGPRPSGIFTLSPMTNWLSSCQLNLCCECHIYNYQDTHFLSQLTVHAELLYTVLHHVYADISTAWKGQPPYHFNETTAFAQQGCRAALTDQMCASAHFCQIPYYIDLFLTGKM